MIGTLFVGAGGILCFVGGLWLLIEAFRSHILWGLGCLFLFPFVQVIFALTHWRRAGVPFLIGLGGSALIAVGVILGGGGIFRRHAWEGAADVLACAVQFLI